MKRMFVDKSCKPNDEMFSRALGRSYKYWQQIENTLRARYAEVTPEWKYYGKSSGWTLKFMLKKRNLFFVAPCDKYFRVAFVFGDKAVQAIEKSDLPAALIEEVKNAKRYPEGRGLRLDLRRREQVEHVIKLTEIKIDY